MANVATPLSLTARLTGGFITVLVVAHIGICVYLDYAFQEEFATEDRRELATHAAFIQQMLAEQRSFEEVKVSQKRLLDAKAPHPRLEFVLSDPQGNTLESSYEARSLGDNIVRQTRTRRNMADLMEKLTYRGRTWRALVTSGTLRNSAYPSIAIVLALDVTERENFIRRYRPRLVTAAVVAIAVAGLVGLPLVRSALSPLGTMARQAREISSNRLNERLPVAAVPRELQILSEAFNETLGRLEDSFRRLSQFSSEVAHELRTPISNLMGEAQVALRRARTVTEYQTVLESAIEECQRVERLVDAMLFLARADNAQIALNRELLDGRQEVARLARDYDRLLTECGVEVRIAGSAQIWADSELLRRAVANLIDNAIVHTPRREVIQISLGIGPESSSLVEISNPGPGIAPNALPRLFDRFYRIDEVGKPAARGFGLGLAIVRTIMQLHGGSASVRSAPEGPTVFTLHFPSEASSSSHGECQLQPLAAKPGVRCVAKLTLSSQRLRSSSRPVSGWSRRSRGLGSRTCGPIGEHAEACCARGATASQPFSTLPPFARHSFSLMDTQPRPLQAFCPLHALLAVEHSLLPLQALMPLHCTLASVLSAATTPTVVARNRLTAQTASAAAERTLTPFLSL